MKKILSEIQSGEFAKNWLAENRAGRKQFIAMREKAKDQPIEKIGADLRAMMPFLKRRREVGVPEEAGVGAPA
jgi:ketol-acid reductoisomerase